MDLTTIIVALIGGASTVVTFLVQRESSKSKKDFQEFLMLLLESTEAQGALLLGTLRAVKSNPNNIVNGDIAEAEKQYKAAKEHRKKWLREHAINDATGGK